MSGYQYISQPDCSTQIESLQNSTLNGYKSAQQFHTYSSQNLSKERKPQKSKNKENLMRNSNNKSLSKIQTEVQLKKDIITQSIKVKSSSKTPGGSSQNLVRRNQVQQSGLSTNSVINEHILSPKRALEMVKKSALSKNKSNNRLIGTKQSIVFDDKRPLSPISSIYPQNFQNERNNSKEIFNSMISTQLQSLSPVNQSCNQLPPSQMRIFDLSQAYSSYNQSVKIDMPRQISKSSTQNQTLSPTQKTSIISYDQPMFKCQNCEQVENKLLRIALQLDIDLNNPSQKKSLLQLLEQISHSLLDFKLDKHNLQQEKLKLQQDLEKLIANQQSFEVKVKELDSVYTLLRSERDKLQDKQKTLDNLIDSKQSIFKEYNEELAVLKKDLSDMKREVRRAVEKEVKETIYRKERDRDYIYDYPRQIEDKKPKHGKSLERSQTIPFPDIQLNSVELKKREQDLDKKESQMYEWEASLFEKKMKIDNANEQLKGKVERLTQQKQEVSQNLKKLQILTQDYEIMLQKEYEMTQMAQKIQESREFIENEKDKLEVERMEIDQKRNYLQTEKLDAAKTDRYIALIKSRLQMQLEDNMSYLNREREKCQTRIFEAQELKSMLLQEKARWQLGIEDKQRKLQLLVDEKREQVQVMEISMRQQIQEIRQRQAEVERREREVEERFNRIKSELEQERGQIDKERADLGCLMLELEEKQGLIGSGKKNQKKKSKKNNMPRQMPQNTNEDQHMLLMMNFDKKPSLQKSQTPTFISTPQKQEQTPSQNFKREEFSKQTTQQQIDLNLEQEIDDIRESLSNIPKYAQTTTVQVQNSRTPKSGRKGIPPKPPTSSQKVQNMKTLQQPQTRNSSNQIFQDLSLDQDQQLEFLLNQDVPSFKKNNCQNICNTQGDHNDNNMLDQYLMSSQNDISLLNDDNESESGNRGNYGFNEDDDDLFR